MVSSSVFCSSSVLSSVLSSEPEPEEEIITAAAEISGRRVTVTGTISTGEGNQIVLSVTDTNGETVYSAQGTSEADGAFSFDFDLPETSESGTYNFYLGTSENPNICSGTFTYTPLPDADESFQTIEASYTITGEADSLNRVIVNVSNVPELNTKVFTIEYNAAQLELVDVCAFTAEKETSSGIITGTDIEILSAESGRITFAVNREISGNTVTSGVVNMLTFRKLTAGETVVNSKIEKNQ